jgi:phosphatidate cytidylyltransferase
MYLPSEYFLFMIGFFSTVALLEFYVMFKIKGLLKYSGLFLGIVLQSVFFSARDYFVEALFLSVLTIMMLRLFLGRLPAYSKDDVATTVFGLLYIPCLLTFQLSLAEAGSSWIILLYASVWAADSLAYYVGKGIGKRKLYEEMSPNKTVAGAGGSLIGGIIGTALIGVLMPIQITLLQIVFIGLAIGISTMIGDLVESMFKRDAGVKDSSNIIPGHGGVLDKLDGVTFAGPVLYWLCIFFGLIH